MIPNIIFPADLQKVFRSSCIEQRAWPYQSDLFYKISNELKNNNEAAIYVFVS